MPRLQTPKRHLRVQLQETLAKSRNSKVPDGCQGWLPAILGCKIKRIWKKTTFVLQPPQVGWVGLLDLLGLVRFVVLYLIYDNISVSQTGTLVLFGLSIGVLKPISQVFDATMIQPTSQWEPHLDEQCCRWRYYENDFDFGDFGSKMLSIYLAKPTMWPCALNFRNGIAVESPSQLPGETTQMCELGCGPETRRVCLDVCYCKVCLFGLMKLVVLIIGL